MSELLGTGGKTLPGIHISVKLAVLEYESEKRLVELRLWPADTLQPARAFYRRRETVDRVLTLTSDGWSVSPNFHFGFMASGCCWTSTTMPVSEYLAYWAEHINDTAQIERPDWGEYWDRLVNLKIAAPADREAFDHYFTDTARTFVAPRPGVRCTFAWHLDRAERLDAQEQLRNAVRERLNRLLLKMGSIRNSIRPDLNTGEHPSPALERGHALGRVDEFDQA